MVFTTRYQEYWPYQLPGQVGLPRDVGLWVAPSKSTTVNGYFAGPSEAIPRRGGECFMRSTTYTCLVYCVSGYFAGPSEAIPRRGGEVV